MNSIHSRAILQATVKSIGWGAAGYVGAALFTTVNPPAAAAFIGLHTLFLRALDGAKLPYLVSFGATGLAAFAIVNLVGLPITLGGAVGTTVATAAISILAGVVLCATIPCWIPIATCCLACFCVASMLRAANRNSVAARDDEPQQRQPVQIEYRDIAEWIFAPQVAQIIIHPPGGLPIPSAPDA